MITYKIGIREHYSNIKLFTCKREMVRRGDGKHMVLNMKRKNKPNVTAIIFPFRWSGLELGGWLTCLPFQLHQASTSVAK